MTIRTIDGATIELVADGDGHWRRPGDVSVTSELDASRWWALTGLADCHAHLGGSDLDHMNSAEGGSDEGLVAASAWAQLEGGVFLVADKGSKNNLTLELRHAPPTERPDLHMAGQVIATAGGYYGDFAVETDDVGLAAVVAEAAAQQGATWVKLIGDWPKRGVGAVPNFSEEAMAEAVRIAHAAGCRMAIHAAAPRTSSMAVAAGIDSIEHGLFLTAEDLVALGARGGAWVPTIVAMEAIGTMLGRESSGGRLFAEGLDNARELITSAAEHGVVVLAGSDLAIPHGGIATEAARLVDYGLTAEGALTATSAAAYAYLGQSDRRFEAGLAADIVCFDRDPRDDITALAEPVFAMRHGRVIIAPS